MKDGRVTNCFNTIRLLAALHVVWIHAATLFELSDNWGIGKILAFFPGVPVFFVLSGYCIWFSICRSTSFGEYCKKRFWRIYPELWLAVAIELVTIMIFFKGHLDWLRFLAFAVGQGTIVPFWTPDFLRGYGCGTPNGVLWTIFALVQFYLLAYPVYKMLRCAKLMRWIFFILALIAVSVGFNYGSKYMPVFVFKIGAISCVPYLWIFVLGAFFAEFQEQLVPIIAKHWYLPVVLRGAMLFVGVPSIPVFNYGFLSTIVAAVAVLAIGYRFPVLNIKKDISYGIYIYHMTVINVMLVLGLSGGTCVLYFMAVVITCALSYISTITVGAYCQNMKTKGWTKKSRA